LLPVLSSTGKGADIMVPMAIPMFGGMVIQVMTVFVVPLFQAMWREGEVIIKIRLLLKLLIIKWEMKTTTYKKLIITFIAWEAGLLPIASNILIRF
jgi:hypothetical protein